MPDPAPLSSLPEDLEDAVLAILEGDDAVRDRALMALMDEHPLHATAIRNWLVAAGVTVGDWHTLDGDANASDDEEHLPRRLGAYLLQAVIGRGGFGTVYRAEQQEPIQRPVAIKVLNPGMDSREVLARFAAEREALNRMDHAGIARLLDAGTTPKGRPFFAMELVEGPTLLTWCRREKLTPRERIGVFLRVCDATQHAHQKAVLHRDLSSNNVLVTADPNVPRGSIGSNVQPKIIDFGIAKSLADPLLQGGAMTFQGTLMGTPEFMSPEQAAGRTDDIDTRADVYALGVQLYELLTDQLPIPGVVLRAHGVAGIAHVVKTHVPPKPSEVAPKPRRALLRGDLDSILQKAIAKELDERYASVGALAADLRRFLADEPVEVAAHTTWYRLRKFVRRNRAQTVAFSIAALGLLAAVVVMAFALLEAHRATGQAQTARDEANAKANVGFRLLANGELLDQAIAAEQQLPPPWPEYQGTYDAWLANFGRELDRARDRVRERLATLAAESESNGGQFADESDAFLERSLIGLQGRLDAFHGPQGLADEVGRRRSFASDRLGPAVEQYAVRWQSARAAITKSDGDVAAETYRGLRIPHLPGLVPAGRHPTTKLWEFVDLSSHEPDYPLPTRDPDTGELRSDGGTGIVFVLLPPGRVPMGARRNQPGMDRNDDFAALDELHGETVTLDAFMVARTELTVAQWARMTGAALPKLDPQLPITNVDWPDARQQLRRWGLSLPTEAQWEYACRAGTLTPWCSGSDPEMAANHGWFAERVHRVGLKQPNAFGLFDLHGNVAEWCQDEKLPYQDFVARDGDGLRAQPATDSDAWRVVRGGTFYDGAIGCRSTARAHHPPGGDGAIGIRVTRRLDTGR